MMNQADVIENQLVHHARMIRDLLKLKDCAEDWAQFQDADSVKDQQTDQRLKDASRTAHLRLLDCINDINRAVTK